MASATVPITVFFDTDPELDESLTVTVDMVTEMSGTTCLTTPDAGITIADGTGTVVITDDDTSSAPHAVRVGDVTIPEGNGPTNGSAKVPVSLSSPFSTAQCVWYHTQDGTASGAPKTATDDSSHDYVSRTGKFVKIPAGNVNAVIDIQPMYDTQAEGTENLAVVIDMVSDSSGSGCLTTANPAATVVDGTGSVTIVDDDRPSVSAAPTNPKATLTEDPCSSACGWVDINWTAPLQRWLGAHSL